MKALLLNGATLMLLAIVLFVVIVWAVHLALGWLAALAVIVAGACVLLVLMFRL